MKQIYLSYRFKKYAGTSVSARFFSISYVQSVIHSMLYLPSFPDIP